jgi:tetratricopeptide (TPR) repeat protein
MTWIAAILLWNTLAGPNPEPGLGLPGGPQGTLAAWLMRTNRTTPARDEDDLARRLQGGEALCLDGGARGCAMILGAALADPAWQSLAGSVLHDNLKYDLAGALFQEGAIGLSRKLLLELIGRKPSSAFQAPAFRKLVDVTLHTGQFEQTLSALSGLAAFEGDEKDEITYLKGRALMKMGYPQEAVKAFAAVARANRHHAAAMYLAGVIALESGDTEEATTRFCRIVFQPSGGRFTFFLSPGTLQVIDHAWLALGSARHDAGEHQRAVDTFLKVQSDSPSFDTAQYRMAWSLFRLERFAESRRVLLRLLDRAQHFPSEAEARVLLGYALMGDCLYDSASEIFDQLAAGWHARSEALQPRMRPEAPPGELPEDLAWVLPPSHQERQAFALLDAIRDSRGRVEWIRGQLAQAATGLAQVPLPRFGGPLREQLASDLSASGSLLRRVIDLRTRALQRGAAPELLKDLDGLEGQVIQTQARAARALQRLEFGAQARPLLPGSSLPDAELPKAYLGEEDREMARLLDGLFRQSAVAQGLADSGRRAWTARAAGRAASWARLATIGQIDAVIGQKQSTEIEVQNLAVGRYPLSLLRELAAAGLVDETMEYWPYDGEDWWDEVQ